MALGNRGFADGLAGTSPPPVRGGRLPPRTGILGERENRLAELAAGNSVTRVHELVDPARCRIWEGHNRDYPALNEINCADLIESFKAQGRQEVAAIVRRVAGDPDHPYEVICGARRHWTVVWLRSHDYPEFKFLIEPRELTDEEAFRIADLENRNRRDLSDYERACDYARAVQRYYGGSQQRMAERLEVSKSWLSRYLDLAKLPPDVVAAFGSPHIIGISHSAAIAPVLRMPAQCDRLLVEARRLCAEQTDLAERAVPPITPAAVVQRLLRVAKESERQRSADRAREHIVRAPDGAILAKGQRAGRGGGVTISIPAPAKHDRTALVAAMEEVLEHIGRFGRSPLPEGR